MYTETKSYKGRRIDRRSPVKFYRNLHTGGYSVVQGAVVVAHAPALVLWKPEFTVRPAGRRLVRETGSKNVHAYVKGSLLYPVDGGELLLNGAALVGTLTYRPTEHTEFMMTALTGETVPMGDVDLLWAHPTGVNLYSHIETNKRAMKNED
jgi:hypothetical protein